MESSYTFVERKKRSSSMLTTNISQIVSSIITVALLKDIGQKQLNQLESITHL